MPQLHTPRWRWLAALGSVLAWAVVPAVADQTLFDFSRGSDAARARLDGGALTSQVSAASQRVLRVETGHAAPWPGIELAAPTGHWDLSGFAEVAVEVANTGTNEVRVECRVDNPGVERGMVNCVHDGLTLGAGSRGTLAVALTRGKPAWVQVELFGMRGYPWGMPVPWAQPGELTIDPARVVNLVIFVPRPSADHRFEVSRISARGHCAPPTELLKDSDRFFPFIDTFGQYRHADWPGKTHAIAELAERRAAEATDLDAHPGPAAWDRYGGWRTGPTLRATGHFYPAKHNGKWWLVDPDGKLFFSQGIDCVRADGDATPVDRRNKWFADLPGRDGEFRGCWSRADIVLHGDYQGQHPECVDFGQANRIRKYGRDWPAAFAGVVHRRLRSWGLNTIGNWSAPAIYLQRKTPYVVSIWFDGPQLQGSEGYWGKFRDVFDPAFALAVRQAMARQAGASVGDAWCLGYFVDNEIAWGEDDTSLAVAALRSPATQPAKRAFVEDLQTKYTQIDALNTAWGTGYASWDALLASTTPPDLARGRADLEAFEARTAQTYFRTVRAAVKAVAPDNLYLGCRFAWANRAAAAAAATACDVVSYNLYRRSVADFRLPVAADVPVIIGEFHFGALDRGLFHTGLVPVADQGARATAYREYVRSVLRHPQFVGCHWFQYADEPTTGRFLDGENYQIGFVDIADTPYAETVAAAREMGRTMYATRAAGP